MGVDPPPLTHLLLPRCYQNRPTQDYLGQPECKVEWLFLMALGCLR